MGGARHEGLVVEGRPAMGGLETLSRWPPVWEVLGKERRYGSTSLFCLRPGHEPRRGAIRLVSLARVWLAAVWRTVAKVRAADVDERASATVCEVGRRGVNAG